MKKGLKIFLTIIIIFVLLAGVALLLIPRIVADYMVTQSGGKEMTAATYFIDYEINNSDTIQAGNGHITVDIPADSVVDSESELENSQVFNSGEKTRIIIMDKWLWGEEMNLTAVIEKGEYQGYKFNPEAVMKEFEEMGLVKPDSAFNTYKCLYLLDNKEYDVVNFNRQLIYTVAATMRKEIMPQLGEAYIYETDAIKGFVYVSEKSDDEYGKYRVTMEIFDVNDLNTSTTVMVNTDDLNEAYAIMNSARAA